MKEESGSTIARVSSIRLKLITAFASLFSVTFFFILISGYTISKSMITRAIDTRAQEVLDGHAAEIDQWIKRLISIVNSYSHLIEKAIPDNNNITSEILVNYARDSFSDLYYGTVSGNFVSSREWKPFAGYDPRNRPWYKAAAKEGKTVIGDLYIDYETHSLAVPVAAPVYTAGGKLRGVLSADLLLYTLEEKLKNMKVDTMGQPMLIDRNGMALVYPDKSVHGRKLAGVHGINEVIATILKNKQGRVEYVSDTRNIIIYTYIPASEWILGMILTEDEIYANLRSLSVKFFVIFAISLIIVIFTSKYFAVRLTYFMQILEENMDSQTAALKEKIAQVEYLSLTDHLTGIANRRKIEEVLNFEIERSNRTGNHLSVIMSDIDSFKKFNDTYGHKTGDEVLKEFAAAISESIRSIDRAGRLGGEEFLIVCPETNLSGAVLLAEKLRAVVESIKIEPLPGITASFGCASYTRGDTMDSLISRSDKAMYKAKELGRNRVESLA